MKTVLRYSKHLRNITSSRIYSYFYKFTDTDEKYMLGKKNLRNTILHITNILVLSTLFFETYTKDRHKTLYIN